MGRESINNDPIVIQPSIALLQERFRQLQRMKEMREERELLRKQATEIKQSNLSEQQSRLFFNFLPVPTVSTSHPQPPLCLWSGSGSGSQNKYWSSSSTDSTSTNSTAFQCMEAQVFASLFTTITDKPNSMYASVNKFQDSDCDDDDHHHGHDVDTSLHL